jgi:anti-sigma factor RsiW
MTCSETSLQLTAYLDHELAAAERGALEGHLATCASCTALLASLRNVAQGLESLPAIEVGADFRRKVLGAIEVQRRVEGPLAAIQRASRRPGGKTFRARWAWPALGALGTLGAAAAAFLAIARGPSLPGDLANAADLAIAGRLELFENYPSVELVDAIDAPEDLQVVAALDSLGAGTPGEGAR